MKSLLLLALAATVVTLTGCSKEDSTNAAVESGIQCLNTAQTATDADACQSKVAGIQTAQAYLVRCSANLIAQGLTGTRIANAFQQLKSTTGTTTNATASLLSYVVFAQNLPLDTAALTLTNCTNSGVQGLTGLANLIQMATTIASLGLGNGASLAGSQYDPSSSTYNQAALAAEIQTLNTTNDPTTNATIGTLAQTAQTQYCSTGSALATQDVCTKLNSAISSGNGNSANIGKSLLNLLAQAQ